MVTDHQGDHLSMYISVESLHCTPELNIILDVNYTSIEIISKKIKIKRSDWFGAETTYRNLIHVLSKI